MRPFSLIGAVLAVLLFGPSSAAATGSTTGMELLNYCGEEPGAFGSALCLGFIEGVEQVESLRRRVCRPAAVTNGQVLFVVQAWLRAHPKELHLLAAILVIDALRDAFPCKARQ